MQLINEELISTDHVPFLSANGVNVFTLRTDKIHPVISGNKWFKLKYYLQDAQTLQKKIILTFGGAFSNHIVATAAACKQANLHSIGIIRGEEPKEWSHTLLRAKEFGMQLHFISRSAYQQKTVPQHLQSENIYMIPEGGYGRLGAAGISTLRYEKEKFDAVCCAVGTGTMMAGLINSKKDKAEIIGISVLKNHYELQEDVLRLLIEKRAQINISHDYHFGGYAKYNSDLTAFMNDLYRNTGIPTDFVYSAKLFYAVRDMVLKGGFQKNSNVLIIHCGGLQGNLSLAKGTLMF